MYKCVIELANKSLVDSLIKGVSDKSLVNNIITRRESSVYSFTKNIRTDIFFYSITFECEDDKLEELLEILDNASSWEYSMVYVFSYDYGNKKWEPYMTRRINRDTGEMCITKATVIVKEIYKKIQNCVE